MLNIMMRGCPWLPMITDVASYEKTTYVTDSCHKEGHEVLSIVL